MIEVVKNKFLESLEQVRYFDNKKTYKTRRQEYSAMYYPSIIHLLFFIVTTYIMTMILLKS